MKALYKQQGNHPLSVRSSSIGDFSKNDKVDIRPTLNDRRDIDCEEGSSANVLQLLKEQRKDIDGVLRSLDELRQDMSSIKVSIKEMKESFKAQDRESNAKYASEEDLEIMADTVTTIQDKITDFDSLRVEMRILKERIKFLEENNPSTQSSHTITGWTQSVPPTPRFARFAGSVTRRAKPMEITPTSPGNFEARQPRNLSGFLERSRNLSENQDLQANNNAEMTIESTGGDGVDTTRNNSQNFQPNRPSIQPRQSFHTETIIKSSNSDRFPRLSPIPLTKLDLQASTPSSLSSAHSSILVFPSGPNIRTKSDPKEPGSAISLNSHKVIPGSDPEDEDYEPNRNYQPKSPLPRPDRSRGSTRRGRGGRGGRGGGRGGRSRRVGRRSKPGLPIPDPEWERPDWDGTAKYPRPKPVTPNSRSRGFIRRGDSGRIPGVETEPKRGRPPALGETFNEREALARGAEGSPMAQRDGRYNSRGRRLNSEGIPLRKNGLPDLRHGKRMRDEDGTKLPRMGEPDDRSVKRLRDDGDVVVNADEEDEPLAKAKQELDECGRGSE